MPVTVYKLEDEDILIATFTGHIVAEDIATMYQRSENLIQHLMPPVYRISDFRLTSSSPPEAIAALKIALNAAGGSTTDPRIRPVLLGDNRWARLAQDAMRMEQYGGINMPLFNTMGDALKYARSQLARRRGAS